MKVYWLFFLLDESIITNTFIAAVKSRASGNMWACSWHIEEPDASFVRCSKLWYVFAFSFWALF